MRTSIVSVLTLVAFVVSTSATCPLELDAFPRQGASAPMAQPRVAVGDAVAAFALTDETGASVSFPAMPAKTTVLVFFRGSWCPYCARQLADLRGLRTSGDDFNLYGISIEPNATNAVFAKRLGADGKGALGFPLLSDPDRRVIDALGLKDERYDGSEYAGIPRATVVVINAANKVTWVKISDDYKLRPSNAEIRAAIDAANK